MSKQNKNREQFRAFYEVRKKALENGKYRISIENLESARKLIGFGTQLGAEVHMLLVTAYQAAGKKQEAIAICQELTAHPNMLMREKAKSVLYIINAPQLERPAEWMSQIPDLSGKEAAKPQYVTTKRKKPPVKKEEELPEIDWSQVNTEDNQFIWFALVLAILTVGGLIWLA